MGSSDEELCAVDITEPVPSPPTKQLPAYNGFGSQEDSAQNCTSLVIGHSCTLSQEMHATEGLITCSFTGVDWCKSQHVLEILSSALQIPRPPRKDFYKLMNKDKAVLRFVCRLVEASGAPKNLIDG